MSNRGSAAIELGAVIAVFVGLAIVKSAYDGGRAPVTQPLSRAQSPTEVSDLQQLNKYFLQNWQSRR